MGWQWHFKGNVCALKIGVVQSIQVPFFNGLRKEKWWISRQYHPWHSHCSLYCKGGFTNAPIYQCCEDWAFLGGGIS